VFRGISRTRAVPLSPEPADLVCQLTRWHLLAVLSRTGRLPWIQARGTRPQADLIATDQPSRVEHLDNQIDA